MFSKKYLTAVLVMVLLFAFGLSLAGAQDHPIQIWLSADTNEVAAGDTVTVTVNVTGAQGVYGGSFKLAYDPTAFEVLQTENKPVVPGEFFANQPGFALRNASDAQKGTIEYALTLMQPAQPVDGDGILGTVTLKALKDTPVNITTQEASFVAPEFKEVEGRTVAERVDQVPAHIEQSAPVLIGASAINSLDSSASTPVNISATQPAQPDVDPAIMAMFNNPALDGELSAEQHDHQGQPGASADTRSTDDIVLLFAGFFFVFGLFMLTLSVGMYSRMRFLFTLSGDMHSQQV
jgi:hypothetical protein